MEAGLPSVGRAITTDYWGAILIPRHFLYACGLPTPCSAVSPQVAAASSIRYCFYPRNRFTLEPASSILFSRYYKPILTQGGKSEGEECIHAEASDPYRAEYSTALKRVEIEGGTSPVCRGSAKKGGLQNRRETRTVKSSEIGFNHRRRPLSCRYKYRSRLKLKQAPA
jgi:hypothetical protein